MPKVVTYRGYDIHVTEKGEWYFTKASSSRTTVDQTFGSLDEVRKYIRKFFSNKPLEVYRAQWDRITETTITSVGERRQAYGLPITEPRYKTQQGSGTTLGSWNDFYEKTPHNQRVLDQCNDIDEAIKQLQWNKQKLIKEALENQLTYERYQELTSQPEEDEDE